MSEVIGVRDCQHCGKSFDIPDGNPEQRFCSISCSNRQKNLNRGFDLYPESKSEREKALERDGYECQRCGGNVRQHSGPPTGSPEVHHVIPRSLGGPDQIENLVTLCSECHKQAHKAFSDIPENNPELLAELRAVVCDDTEDGADDE